MLLSETVTTAPAVEPVTGEEVKASARIDGTEFDAQLPLMIQQAREAAEHESGRRFITQTLRVEFDDWDSTIALPQSPVQSVTSVNYHDGTDWQTLEADQYALVQLSNGVATIYPATPTTDWPTLGDIGGARVRVVYVAGYGDEAADVPGGARLWIIANCVHWLDNPAAAHEKALYRAPFVNGLLDSIRSWK